MSLLHAGMAQPRSAYASVGCGTGFGKWSRGLEIFRNLHPRTGIFIGGSVGHLVDELDHSVAVTWMCVTFAVVD